MGSESENSIGMNKMAALGSCDGKPSGTKKLFTLMTVVIAIRVLFAGVEIPGLLSVANEIDGTGYALILGALGGTYWARHNRRLNGG